MVKGADLPSEMIERNSNNHRDSAAQEHIVNVHHHGEKRMHPCKNSSSVPDVACFSYLARLRLDDRDTHFFFHALCETDDVSFSLPLTLCVCACVCWREESECIDAL